MKRLNQTVLAPGRISARQFGFTPGKSTEDAIVELRRIVDSSENRYAVALLFDISGAFDNVWWPLVFKSLRERGCPRNVFEVLKNYFDNRRVGLEIGSIKVSKRATRGCPQGSVLGPACWNLMFDDLLRSLEDSIGNKFVAYADDLLVVIEGDSRLKIEIEGQRLVNHILEWCRGAKLEISERKTEAIVLKSDWIERAPIGRRGGARPDRKRKAVRPKKAALERRPPTIRIGNYSIKFKNEVRYLGVHFGTQMSVSAHCSHIGQKVGKLFGKLARLASSRWGLRHEALSRVYKGVFKPIAEYAASGWADLCKIADKRRLQAIQRQALLAVTKAYRTASWESLCVIAGEIPIDLQLEKHRALFNLRRGKDAKIADTIIPAGNEDSENRSRVSEIANSVWQTRWNSSHKGRTAFAYWQSIDDRLKANWVRPSYYCTQALTGHGNFNAHLRKFKIVENEGCVCGAHRDTVPHLLLECRHYNAQREALRELVPIGKWKWPDAAQYFVQTPEAFSLFADYCEEALWLKERETV